LSDQPLPGQIRRRSQLLSLLTEACELEHGLACSYLFAAFTLKQDLSEGGLDWRQLQRVRFWAAQLYFIAAQEMLHLAQVWNLQAAIGGRPYYLRPNFPQPSKYYPLNLPLRLERFSLATLDRFIQFERPADVIVHAEGALEGAEPLPAFKTVGQLYELIADDFVGIPNLFLGHPDRQVGQDLVDFPDLVRVSSVEDALRAIQLITRQGEGIDNAHADCHFAIFRAIRREYLLELAEAETTGVPFEPVRQAISNPAASVGPQFGAVGANLITDALTSDVADCFDSIYAHMLRMLQYVFDNATDHSRLLKAFGHGALEAMTAVLKPLGEALTLMPAGSDYEAQTAGPGFALVRHVALPTDAVAASIVAAEKIHELSVRLNALTASHDAVPQLKSAAANLERMAQRFAQVAKEMRETPAATP
jgi:hypothetical protein